MAGSVHLRQRRGVLLLRTLGAATLLAVTLAMGQEARSTTPNRFSQAAESPTLEQAQSVEIRRQDEPLYVSPSPRAKRRGAARRGARLPLYSHLKGPGCDGAWLEVGPLAWVCEAVVELSQRAALSATDTDPRPPDGMPYRYYFVSDDGSLGYRDLSTAEQGYPDLELDPGFAVGVQEIRRQQGSELFARTTHDLWVPLRDLRPIQAPPAYGVSDPKKHRVWVVGGPATPRNKPGGHRLKGVSYERLTALPVLETQTLAKKKWFRVADDQWLSEAQVTWRREAPPPEGHRPGERWIDVDLERQLLTAYLGSEPVFATIVSTGKGPEGAENATPKGTFRIWVKLTTSDMDNLEDDNASRYYAMQSVPWVMYFHKGYGLHGAFWHSAFGQVRSHGCVNLAPRDARSLFDFAGPRMPAGWTAVFPTDYDLGTLVRVR